MNFNNFTYLICSGLGVGNLSFFPGTLASISVLPLAWIIKNQFSFEFFTILIFTYSIVGIILVNFQIKGKKNKDPSYIVIDEHIGQLISLIFCEQKIFEYFFSFVLFRFFDIVKPFPINLIDKKTGAIYVILDDIIAGIFVSLIFLLFI